LGIALVLAKRFSGGTETAKDTDISRIVLQATLQLKKNQSDQSLFLSTPTGCLTSFTTPNELFHKISGVDEYDLKKILTFIKRMIFYCKYMVVPIMNLEVLTFDKIFNEQGKCVQHVDPAKFNENVAKQNFILNKTQLYASDNLKRAQASSAQASSATPAPAPAQPSLESRVSTLEDEVAELKARQ
jgi:hypothetical protein